MLRCIDLAKNGLGSTYPNPLVGCVVVYKDKIIGEGWHQKAGEAHAEVKAINSVKDKSLLSKSTIYVNLEPCSHWGKTPPCADLIVKMKIKNVVIGTVDFNDKVHGKGILHLQKNGCKVKVGVLEKECRELNKRFFTFHQKNRPYIMLKWAETKDGFIFSERTNKNKKPIWISNTYSLQLVHKWRTEEQAILVGTNTAIIDNPKLNARNYFGKSPIRIMIDRELKIPKDFNLYNGELETIIFTEKDKSSEIKKLIFQKINFSKNLVKQICDVLYEKDIQSIIIEGGTKTLQSFIDENIWDEARVFVGDSFFKTGLKSPDLDGEIVKELFILNDKLTFFKN